MAIPEKIQFRKRFLRNKRTGVLSATVPKGLNKEIDIESEYIITATRQKTTSEENKNE